MSTPDIDCSRRRPPQALIHTPHSPSLQRGEERGGSRLAGQPFRGSDFPFPNSNLRQVAHVLRPSRCGEGGHAGGLEGPKPPGATCPPIRPRWRTCSSPPRVARGAGQVAWRGPKPLAPPERSHGHRRRLESTPGAFCTVLPMATGGVSHLLQVLFALFCSWSKWLKPPAFCAKSCKGLVEARGAFRVCLVQNPAFCGFQVARRESGGVEPPTWDHLSWAQPQRSIRRNYVQAILR